MDGHAERDAPDVNPEGVSGAPSRGLLGLAGVAASQKGMDFQGGRGREEKACEDGGWEWSVISWAEAATSCIMALVNNVN